MTPDEGGRRRPRRPRTRISIRTNQRPGERGDAANATTAAAIDVILQNLFGGIGPPGSTSEDGRAGPSGNVGFPFNLLRLHGNPADYVWGTEGLDSIITQLLNQMEGAGPPPADADKIETLPKVIVSQELVDAHTDCAVCQDKLTLGEEVRQLPCRHLFHFDCIQPWLKLHDSCPICRVSLNNTHTRVS
ncbi:E3 ubiquitin-protein ligase RNF126-like [Oculina patagonica]